MKILLSPSKTQDFSKEFHGLITSPTYEKKAIALNDILKNLPETTLKNMMRIDGDLLDQTRDHIEHFSNGQQKQAIAVYTGLVFKYFDLETYGEDEYSYLNSHLMILSAMYGVLRPFDGIKPYRLDMKMKPEGINLYDYWSQEMDQQFLSEDIIIDLASQEFSKMVKGNKITVGFREYKDGKYKNLATYSKMARGMLLHQMVLNKTKNVESLKNLTFGRYTFNPNISSDTLLLFSRSGQSQATSDL